MMVSPHDRFASGGFPRRGGVNSSESDEKIGCSFDHIPQNLLGGQTGVGPTASPPIRPSALTSPAERIHPILVTRRQYPAKPTPMDPRSVHVGAIGGHICGYPAQGPSVLRCVVKCLGMCRRYRPVSVGMFD